jgi:hypothetical protein
MTMRAALLAALAAFASTVAIAACGETAPSQEEFEAQARALQSKDAAACKLSSPSGQGQSCDQCLQAECCTIFDACSKDAACNTLDGCIGQCYKTVNPQAPDARTQLTNCGNACYQASPSGVSKFEAAQHCSDKCVQYCV